MGSKFTGRVKASVLSLAIAATSVPAAMAATPAGAVTEANITADVLKTAAVTLAVDDSTTGTIPAGATSITFTIESEYATSFSYGLGVSTSSSGYWSEHTKTGTWASKGSGYSVDLKVGTNKITVELPSDVTTGTGSKYELRCYYCSHWDNSVGDMVENSVTLTGVSADGGSSTEDPSETPEIPHNNKKSGEWGFTDNGDGTATIWATYTKQLEELDTVLTQGYDEDYYKDHPEEAEEEGYPINSRKFSYSEFGITDLSGITIESLTATIESDTEMATFMYGGGLNVESGSPSDTEYAKVQAGVKESGSYWYNDMGAEEVEKFEAAGVEFGITPGNGCTATDAGTYYNAYWEVPAEVQKDVTTRSNDSISFQFWYGVGAEEAELKTVTLTGAALTYTKTVTVPYTASVETAVKSELTYSDTDLNSLKVPYADLGIDEKKKVYAIRFDISTTSDIEKLVYNVGTSTSSEATDYWYQDEVSYVVLNAGDTAELMWIVPKNLAGTTADTNIIGTDGEVYFGYYYGAADSIKIDNIEVYYDEPVVTTTTTTATVTTTTTTKAATTTTTAKATTTTTKAVTTTTTAPTTADVDKVYGDANGDGIVSVADPTLIMQVAANPNDFSIKDEDKPYADVSGGGDGITPADALTIQKYLAGSVSKLPE